MESQGYDAVQARAYILEQYRQQGDFLELFSEEELGRMVNEIMTFDDAYMEESGVNSGGVYDDDAAYTYLHKMMSELHPAHQMYMMRFVEDYLDYNEAYLDSLGIIEWE